MGSDPSRETGTLFDLLITLCEKGLTPFFPLCVFVSLCLCGFHPL